MSLTKIRTIALNSLIVLFLVGVVWIIVSFFMTPTLTVITNSAANSIVIQENSPNSHPINVDQSSAQITARVEAGNFTVTVKNQATSSMQVVDLSWGDHKTVTLNLNGSKLSLGAATPVTSLGAGGFVASSSNLLFYDKNSPDAPLYMVSQNNHVTTLDKRHPYVSVGWADDSYGIGEIANNPKSYGLVKIENQSVADVALPFTATVPISYAVAPNKSWYVSDGHTVYFANADGSFRKIYTNNKTNVTVSSASISAVLLSEKDTSSTREGDLVVLHTDGTKYQIGGDAYESSWSPSGTKLITSGDTAEIFDNSLDNPQKLPIGNVVNPIWLDDATLLYVRGSDVWSYNLTTQDARIVASIDPLVGNFSTISLNSDHTYLYASVFRNGYINPTFDLYRFSIGSESAPDPTVAQRLLLVMPHIDNYCTVNFVNFTALTVFVKQVLPGQNCIATAKTSVEGSKILDESQFAQINYQQLP